MRLPSGEKAAFESHPSCAPVLAPHRWGSDGVIERAAKYRWASARSGVRGELDENLSAMSKARNENKAGGPSVLRFKVRIVRDPTAAKASWTRLNVPKAVSEQLRGMAKVEGTMNGHPFRAPLEPNTPGGYWLRVNKAMREGAGAEVGDTVELAILGPEPEPREPADLRVALAASREARTLWKDLTTIGRRDWIRWIESTKNPETRARRVRRTVEQLSSGKRRPCCVNVYEFMLSRVRE